VSDKADRIFIGALAAFTLLGFSAVALSTVPAGGVFTLPAAPSPSVAPAPAPTALAGSGWFSAMRGYCNPVDVVTRISASPAPETPDGTMHEAACYALAGRMEDARASLLSLSGDEQWQGAGVVFNAGHPAADAGDDLAAGPLMELVVEFWRNHYMALYHAGAAAFELGEMDRAGGYLLRFLDEYDVEDGWRSNAQAMLAEIG